MMGRFIAPVFCCLSGLALCGCIPDFDKFLVASDGGPDTPTEDGGRDADPDHTVDADDPQPDGGGDAEPITPVDLGDPCGDPHLVVTLRPRSGSGLLLRRNLSDSAAPTPCLQTEHAQEHRAFGSELAAVAAMGGSMEVVAIGGSLLALDRDGFPIWRYQPWNDSDHFAEIFPLTLGGQHLLAALYCAPQSCYAGMDGMLLLDQSGTVVAHVEDLPSGVESGAAHPDGSDSVIFGEDWDPLASYNIALTTQALAASDGQPVGTGFDIADIGELVSLESDVESGRFLAVYDQGVVQWRAGDSIPTEYWTCAACAEDYYQAAIDPLSNNGVFVVCKSAENGSHNHVVHMSGESCSRIVDGSLYTDYIIEDVALVRGPN